MVCAFLLLLAIYPYAYKLEGVIIVSPQTPYLLTKACSSLQTNYSSLTVQEYNSQIMNFFQISLPNFVVDASFSRIVSLHLDTFSKLFGVLVLKLGKPEESETRNEWKFFSSPSVEYETQAFEALISFFNWENFHLFSSQKPSSLKSAKLFQNYHKNWILDESINIVTELMSLQVMINYIGRLIKPSGNWKLLIFNEQESSSKILQALQKTKMIKKGCGVVLKFSGLQQIPKQIIVVAQQGTEYSSNYYELQVKELELTINLLERVFQQNCNRGIVSNDCLRQGLEELTENRGRVPTYLILNSKQEDNLIPIGIIEGQQVILQGNITLPGGQSFFTNEILKILYSQNSGYINHLGEVDYDNYLHFKALQIKLDIINEDNTLLNNFQLFPVDVDCGSLKFYQDYFIQCYQDFRDSLGSFFIHSASRITFDIVHLWREMGITQLQIGQVTSGNELYQKQDYPQIVFSTAPRQLMYNFLPTFLLYHGWKNVIVIQRKNSYEDGNSIPFYKSCQNNEITVHNSQQTRSIPNKYKTETHFEDYKHYFQEYYDSGVRVIVLLQMWRNYLYVIESLYKIGFRKGDIQIVSIYDPMYNINSNGHQFQQEALKKIKTLLNGSTWIYQGQYVDEFQHTLKPIVEETLAPDGIERTCYFMDQLQLGALGIDTLLTTGRDYEDYNLINESVRMQRFKDCSGTFSIDSSSNERRDFLHFLGYVKFDLSTGEDFRYTPGRYSAIQNPLMIIEGEFQYSNESTSPPSDMRFKSWDCDFPMEIVEQNLKSLNLKAILLGSVVGGSVGIASVLILIFKKKQPFELSSENNVMGLDDIMDIVSIPIENIQYLQIGPDFSQYNTLLNEFTTYASLFVLNIQDWKKESFWKYERVCFALSSVWIFLILNYFLALNIRINSDIRKFFLDMGQNVLPGLTNIIVVPLLMSLFEILKCNNETSQELEDSYMNRDCDTFCWRDTHLKNAIGSLCLIFLLNLSILLYKFFQSYSKNRNILMQPLYSYIKNLLQIILSSLSFILKTRFSQIFNLVFSLVMIGNLIVSYKLRIYNYTRIKVIQVFAVGGVVWSVLLTTVFDLVTRGEVNTEAKTMFILFQITGWICIFCTFVVVFTKLPRVFLKLKSKYEVIELFKFMFGKQPLKTAGRVTEKYKKNISIREEVRRSIVIPKHTILPSTHGLIN